MADFLRGYARQPGRIHIKVEYAASLSESLSKGAAILNGSIVAALNYPENQVTVMGHSRGAEVAGTWLREYGRQANRPPAARLRFILLGNPRRVFGGDAKTGQTRTPNDTDYAVIDIARRWDGWANADNWPAQPGESKFRLWWGSKFDHGSYEDVGVDDCVIRKRVGATDYLVHP